MTCLGILWAQYGPYHFARAEALSRAAAPARVAALELSNQTQIYQWNRTGGVAVVTICPNRVAEHVTFTKAYRETRRKLRELGVEVCLLPSYSPRQSLAALLAAKSLGVRTVMMNESHAGTARATGLAAWVKRRLVGLFDAALVGGKPQKRYFVSMGLPEEKVFTGYDAVDNEYFAGRAAEIRAHAAGTRARYALPDHYFLSLGRFVGKKNLSTLIRAFRLYLDANPSAQTHLVMVGSGDEETNLHSLCVELGLPVYDRKSLEAASNPAPIPATGSGAKTGVHFYGFRQIDENPIFYTLADAFVLPSAYEEWGLVVNEAMASGLPVVVSQTAGCAEDLLEPGWPADSADAEKDVRPNSSSARICRNGFVFDPQSPSALADALLALDRAPGLRAAMGQASERAIKNYSCAAFAEGALKAVRAATS